MLANELRQSLRNFPACPERQQISVYVGKATRYALSADATRAIAETIVKDPSSIERCLDHIALADDPMWLEFPHAEREAVFRSYYLDPTRAVENQAYHKPSWVGALLSSNPENNAITVVTAWKNAEKAAQHSYAIMHWPVDNLIWLAHHARRYFSRSGVESCARMLDAIRSEIPYNLQIEIEKFRETDDTDLSHTHSMETRAHAETTSEAVFLMGACLMLRARDTIHHHPKSLSDENKIDVTIPRRKKKRVLAPHGGFYRQGSKGTIVWKPFNEERYAS